MFVETTNGVFGVNSADSTNPSQPLAETYAQRKNSRFANVTSEILTPRQRWDQTYANLPQQNQAAIDRMLAEAVKEFKRRNPNLKSWKDIEKYLAQAVKSKMSNVKIDGTMQRLLTIPWVLELLNKFTVTKVVPIQVYQPNAKEELYLAWDGQHTLVLLWLVAVYVFGEDPENVTIPVNIYSSHLKPEMRTCFVDLNSSEGKRGLDPFDLYEQMVYGVRIDNATKPEWIEAEAKQSILEDHGLFVTAKKFYDDNQAGAISRIQEINKLKPEPLSWLCDYLVAVGAQDRPVEEKEMVMMAFFFERCHYAELDVTAEYINDVAAVAKRHWNADFSPMSKFWGKAHQAYHVWHQTYFGNTKDARFQKEPLHGYPFLVAQLEKDLPDHKHPRGKTNSEFVVAADGLDLF
jgi:hypothetical protein